MAPHHAELGRYKATGRTSDQERMVRFGYYAGMAAQLLRRPEMAETMALLATNDYPVLEQLQEISTWCYDAAYPELNDER
jgi:hypothetical protein